MSPGRSEESERVAALRAYDILDTPPEKSFDDLTSLASQVCETPIALISLVDTDRQWFKSKIGMDVTETSRDISFCQHAIQNPNLFLVRDAVTDERFANSPLVTADPKIRFYAAAPVFSLDGRHALGTICVLDRIPRDLTSEQQEALQALARQVQAQLELRFSLNREKKLARIDGLTGIPNRRGFYEVLQRERNRAQRHNRSLTIAYIDLDNFKQVNDTLGHQAGDGALVKVAGVMGRSLRQADLVARLGGDEFAILLTESGPDQARQVIAKLESRLRDAMEEDELPITFSIGVVTFVVVLASVEELLQKADEVMYFVKSHGKSNVSYLTISEAPATSQPGQRRPAGEA